MLEESTQQWHLREEDGAIGVLFRTSLVVLLPVDSGQEVPANIHCM